VAASRTACLLLNSGDGNDRKRVLMALKRAGCVVVLKRAGLVFLTPDIQSDILSPSRMHVIAFFTDQQSTEEKALRFA